MSLWYAIKVYGIGIKSDLYFNINKMRKNDNITARTFMKNKLEIRVWPTGDGYWWSISYQTDNWTLLKWTLPDDLYDIAKDLWRELDIEVAKVVYECMEQHFNEVYALAQTPDDFITQLIVNHHVNQLKFPDFRDFENEIRSYHSYRINTPVSNVTVWPSITRVGGTPYYAYQTYENRWPSYKIVTPEEYQKLRDEWRINPNDTYLVHN